MLARSQARACTRHLPHRNGEFNYTRPGRAPINVAATLVRNILGRKLRADYCTKFMCARTHRAQHSTWTDVFCQRVQRRRRPRRRRRRIKMIGAKKKEEKQNRTDLRTPCWLPCRRTAHILMETCLLSANMRIGLCAYLCIGERTNRQLYSPPTPTRGNKHSIYLLASE